MTAKREIPRNTPPETDFAATCPDCGTAATQLTGQVRPVHTPSGEFEDVDPKTTSVDFEWKCSNGHRFWAKPADDGQMRELPAP